MRGTIVLENVDNEIIEKVFVDESEESRSKAKIYLTQNKLVIEIEAKDFNALRASINSYLRLIRVCVETLEVIKNG
uniref:KEOPS complex Pcc1-like subunit n=1 Tax=Geoglobus ahangari TaxID=113653 RepID=A0A7C3YN02_9EURY